MINHVKVQFDWEKQAILVGKKKYVVLASTKLEVFPQHVGNGRAALKMMESIAEQNGCCCVAGSASDDTVDFYRKCGWLVSPEKNEEMWTVTSKIAV